MKNNKRTENRFRILKSTNFRFFFFPWRNELSAESKRKRKLIFFLRWKIFFRHASNRFVFFFSLLKTRFFSKLRLHSTWFSRCFSSDLSMFFFVLCRSVFPFNLSRNLSQFSASFLSWKTSSVNLGKENRRVKVKDRECVHIFVCWSNQMKPLQCCRCYLPSCSRYIESTKKRKDFSLIHFSPSSPLVIWEEQNFWGSSFISTIFHFVSTNKSRFDRRKKRAKIIVFYFDTWLPFCSSSWNFSLQVF